MKKLIITLLVVAAGAALAYGYRCQYDNMNMIWTGRTKVEWGKLAKEYCCPTGHCYWVVE